jgi:hypothetical protein
MYRAQLLSNGSLSLSLSTHGGGCSLKRRSSNFPIGIPSNGSLFVQAPVRYRSVVETPNTGGGGVRPDVAVETDVARASKDGERGEELLDPGLGPMLPGDAGRAACMSCI